MSPLPAEHRFRIVAWLLPLALVFASCANEGEPVPRRVVAIATTSILGDIARGVIGDQGDVEVLIPMGANSHEFQPSARQASRIAGADLVVASGLGLEQGLQDVLEAADEDGAHVIELAPLVDPLPFSEQAGRSEDPHFWMDPVRVGDAALALAADLTEIYPDGAWEEQAREYVAEMESTDRTIRDLVEQIPEADLQMVTNHEAFGYFAARYGFEVIGVVIPGGSTLAEPSSAELAGLVETMKREGAKAIFTEVGQSSTLARSVAAEVGDEVQIVELFTESLGPPGSGAETLREMLLTNARRIAAALG
ncbi:MAG TPA: metal ABC transporter substrate-binding protein [Acidimicrobiia bacterium]|nr:metal ABC transporter substrate-binding protein [Acidimicrobiia bacterium]